MANKWSVLKRGMSPKARARVDARVKATLAAMPLAEIRKAIGMTQADLAGKLGVAQGSVSKLEHAADMYLTTLRRYVEAMGGELHLTAKFDGGREVAIEQLAAIGAGAKAKNER